MRLETVLADVLDDVSLLFLRGFTIEYSNEAASAGMKMLADLLARALEMRADRITLEYNRGELEIFFVSGATGIGHVVDSERAHQLFEAIDQQVNLGNRFRGKIKIPLAGVEHAVAVRQYENFDEPAFELKITSAQKRLR